MKTAFIAFGIGVLLAITVTFGVIFSGPKAEPQKSDAGVHQTVTGGSGSTNVAARDVVVNQSDPEVPKKLDAIQKQAEEQRQRDAEKAKLEEAERIRLKVEKEKRDREEQDRLAKEKKDAAERAYREAIKSEVAAINAVAGINRRDPAQLGEFAKLAADMRQYAATGRFYAAQTILWIEEKKPEAAEKAFAKSIEYYKIAKDDNMLRWLDEELKPKLAKP